MDDIDKNTEEIQDDNQDKDKEKEANEKDVKKEGISDEVKEVVQGVVKADLHRYDSPLKSM